MTSDKHELRFTIPADLHARITEYRRTRREIPSIAEAVRQLIEAGIAAQQQKERRNEAHDTGRAHCRQP